MSLRFRQNNFDCVCSLHNDYELCYEDLLIFIERGVEIKKYELISACLVDTLYEATRSLFRENHNLEPRTLQYYAKQTIDKNRISKECLPKGLLWNILSFNTFGGDDCWDVVNTFRRHIGFTVHWDGP